MALEIKKFETGYYAFFGSECVTLHLDDYADTNTIKCKIANIGDEIIPEKFSFSGDPYFSYEVFKKYSKGEHYANIYVEVKYTPKELELNRRIYDTEEGLNTYIKDLETLNKIINIRSIAYRKKKIVLHEFVYKGILKFDQFGQVIKLFDKEFIPNTPLNIMSKIVDYEVFNSYCKQFSGVFTHIPTPNEKCVECGKQFTLDDIDDYITVEDLKDYTRLGYHKNCLRIHNNREQLKEFGDIFSKVYDLKDLTFTEIPNEYCPCERCATWAIISTPDGDIKIGWRKRVINIKWLENYKPFTEKFESEDVTKGTFEIKNKENITNETFIHAWSIDKAIEYLIRAKESVIK